MTLDKAIEIYEKCAKHTWNGKPTVEAEECQQMVEWLKDYKRLLEQEPKIGYWEKDEYGNIHCTFCGCNAMYDKILYPDDYFGKVIRVTTDYCPTCGARMRGDANVNDK